MSEAFASYKKEVETTWVKTTHKVRIRLGATAADILHALQYVPGRATVHEVVDDQSHDEFNDCGEIVFVEEREA
jgi:hypothetical protein